MQVTRESEPLLGDRQPRELGPLPAEPTDEYTKDDREHSCDRRS